MAEAGWFFSTQTCIRGRGRPLEGAKTYNGVYEAPGCSGKGEEDRAWTARQQRVGQPDRKGTTITTQGYQMAYDCFQPESGND